MIFHPLPPTLYAHLWPHCLFPEHCFFLHLLFPEPCVGMAWPQDGSRRVAMAESAQGAWGQPGPGEEDGGLRLQRTWHRAPLGMRGGATGAECAGWWGLREKEDVGPTFNPAFLKAGQRKRAVDVAGRVDDSSAFSTK